MLDLLEELVAIRSLSGAEESAAGFVEYCARSAGFKPRCLYNNVWFELGSGRPRLLLNSHIDTVPPGEGWETDPWRPVIDGGRLTGLGANDAKGCVAAILLAAQRLAGCPGALGGSVVVAITAEEETGGERGITALLPELGQLDAAVIGEPTGLAPCNAQSGMLLLSCTAEGTGGHTAHAAALGLPNAIHTAARDIARLAELRLEPWPGLGSPAAPQVTMIQGGTSRNQLPQSCEFEVDIRTTPNLDHAELTASISDTLESAVGCRSDRYHPVVTPATAPIVRAAIAASGKPPVYSGTCSDWSLLDPGLPAVKLGPGDSQRSHRPGEYLLAAELAAGVDCYAATVRNYFREYHHA